LPWSSSKGLRFSTSPVDVSFCLPAFTLLEIKALGDVYPDFIDFPGGVINEFANLLVFFVERDASSYDDAGQDYNA